MSQSNWVPRILTDSAGNGQSGNDGAGVGMPQQIYNPLMDMPMQTVMPLAMTSTQGDTPLISAMGPANGGLQQFSRPVNIYNGQQWPVQVGMDACPQYLKSEIKDNPGAAALAAFGSDWAKYANDVARQCGGGDKTFDISNQIIRDANPLAVDAGDMAQHYLKSVPLRALGMASEVATPVLKGLLDYTPLICK